MQKKNYLTLIVILALLMLLGLLWYFSFQHLNFESVKKYTLEIQTLAQKHVFIAASILFLIQIVGMFFTLPTKAIFNIVAGALLGLIPGAVITIAGTLIGTSGLFFLSKRLVRQSVSKSLPHKLKKFEKKLTARPLLTVASLRLILALPYGGITLFSAMTNIRYRAFILGSFLGDVPVVLLYSAAGLKLAELASAKEALSFTTVVILTFAGIGLFAGVLWPNKSSSPTTSQ